MAPLTWRNVDAPSASDAAQLLSGAANSLQSGVGMLSNGLMTFQDRRSDDRSAAVLSQLAGLQGEADVNGFLKTVGGQIAPQDINAELAQALAGLRTTGMGYDTTRLNNNLASSRNARDQGRYGMDVTQFNRGIKREDQAAAIAGQVGDRLQSSYGMMTPEIQNGIFQGESGGDYDALFDFSNRPGGKYEGVKLTDMTLNDALSFTDPVGEYGQWVKGKVGRVATPIGAYQIVGSTLREAAQALGLKGDEKMTPALQDRLGEWVLRNQGTGAWEGYRGPSNQAPISTLLGPDNLLTPDMITSIVKGEYDARQTSSVDSDENRNRDYNFGRTVIGDERNDLTYDRGEEAYQITEAAKELALKAQRNSGSVQEALRSVVTDETLSPDLIDATVARITQTDAGGYGAALTPPPDLTGVNTPDQTLNAAAQTAVDAYNSESAMTIASNDTLRIQERAEAEIGTKDPAQFLLDSIPNLNDSIGQVRQRIETVARETGVSPAMAAILISETTSGRGMLGRLWDWSGDDIVTDADAAIELGRKTLSKEAIQAGSVEQTVAAQRASQLQMYNDSMTAIDAEIQNRMSRGLAVDPALMTRKEQLADAILNYEERFPVPTSQARRETPSTVEKAAEELRETPTEVNANSSGTPNETVTPETLPNGKPNAAKNIPPDIQVAAINYLRSNEGLAQTLEDPLVPVETKVQGIEIMISKVTYDRTVPSTEKDGIKQALEAFKTNILNQDK